MPAATSYSEVNSRELRERAEAERTARRSLIDAAFAYYEGNQWRPLRRTDVIDHNVVVNLVQQHVERLVAFLFPRMPGLELLESGQSTATEKALRQTWSEVGGATLLTEIALSGCLAGHVFTRIIQPDRMSGQGLRVVNLDPRSCQAYWKADDVDQVLWYSIQHQADRVIRRQDIVRDGSVWRIVDWEYRREWVQTGEAVWNFPLGPIVDWKHGVGLFSYYGRGEVPERQRELNDKLNLLASDAAKILYYHSSPRTIATGTDDIKPVETGPDRMYQVKNSQARVYNLEMQSDLKAANDFMAFLERQYFAQSRVVRLSGDIRDMQRVTNLGIRALFLDELSKGDELWRRYERGIQELSMRMQMLLGLPIERPTVHRPDPLPQDPIQTVELMERERALGLLSKEGMAHELNIDFELEQERMLEDDMNELLAMETVARRPGFGVGGQLQRAASSERQAASGNGSRLEEES